MKFLGKFFQLSKEKKFLIVSVLLVISGLYLLIIRPGFQTKPAQLAGAKQIEVVLTSDGFSPKEVSIRQGDSIRFTSSLGKHFWPASDLHPTHNIYSEFDPKLPIDPDKSWTFRFDKVGEWKYHDHLSPYFTGKVVVLESSGTISLEQCGNSQNSTVCWQELLITSLNAVGLDKTFDLVKELYAKEPTFATSCHYLTHNVGIASYKLYLKDKNSVLTPKSAFCANGFYHGFMEAFLGASKNRAEAKVFCDLVRVKLLGKAPDAELQCYHGIGHGAMDLALADTSTKANDLLTISSALKVCQELSDSEEKIYRCSSGVFNGIANFYITGEHGLFANLDDPLWVCHVQEERYKEPCYGNMNSYLFWAKKEDLLEAARLVEKISEDKYALPTMRYLSALGSLYLIRDNPGEAIETCRSVQKRLFTSCLRGLVHGILEHGSPDAEYQEAISFCRSAILTEGERDTCMEYALSNLTGWYSREKANQICSGVEEKYRHYCSNL